jgi:effector-binding domain-containing protein
MTAPVSQIKSGTGFLIQFTMPQKFTMETLPVPNDARVHIHEIPERRIAVFRYSGTWSEERYLDKLKEFVSILKQDGVVTTGDPVFARYNPPFMPWFLRRNEIWLETVGK